MDDRGGFVVTWVQRLTNGDTNVVARPFDPNGNPVGDVVQVGVGTFHETDPDVATDALGNFVVSYTRDTNNNNPDIFAKQFRFDTGGLVRVLNVATTSKAENRSSIAVGPFGEIDVAYQLKFSSSDDDILLARFSAAGAPLGTLSIATSTAREQAPSLATDGSGNAVVAYQKLVGGDWDIKARRVNAAGTMGPELTIVATFSDELFPDVALDKTNGKFVVTYSTPGVHWGSSYLREVSAADAVGPVITLSTTAGGRVAASISASTHQYLLAFAGISVYPDWDIYGKWGVLV